MNTIKQRRQALNIKQQQLAREAEIERSRLCRIERETLRARPDEGLRIADVLKCRLQDLELDLDVPFVQDQGVCELLERFRKPAVYKCKGERSIESRLPVLREQYGVDVKKLMADGPMNRFLHDAPGESALEPYFWSRRRDLEGAIPTRYAPQRAGFDLHPVVSPNKPRRVVGHCLMPAMATEDWLAILQVGVQTPRYFRMDALIVTFRGGRRRFVVLELDGPGKPPPNAERDRLIGLKVIRFTLEEIERGVGISDKLDELFGPQSP